MHDTCFREWRISGILGEGAQGKVYQIERLHNGKAYAAAMKIVDLPSPSQLKAMDPRWSDSETKEWIDSLRQQADDELHALYQLRGHPNILSIDDHLIACHPQGFGFRISMRMPFCTPLPHFWKGGGVDKSGLVSWYTHMCEALDASHQSGIIHRDMKPDNMFVSIIGDKPVHKLGDFGISRLRNGTADSPWKSNRMYQSPAVYRGAPYSIEDDWYALNLVLYRVLNGGLLPYQGILGDVEDLEAALHARCSRLTVPPLSHMDRELSECLCSALVEAWGRVGCRTIQALLESSIHLEWCADAQWMLDDNRNAESPRHEMRRMEVPLWSQDNFHIITSLRSPGRSTGAVMVARRLIKEAPKYLRKYFRKDFRIAVLDFSRHPDLGVWFEGGMGGIESVIESPWMEAHWSPVEVTGQLHVYSRHDAYLDGYVPVTEGLKEAIGRLCEAYDVVIAEVHHEWLNPFDSLGGSLHVVTTCDPGHIWSLRGWLGKYRHWQNRSIGIIINKMPESRSCGGLKEAILEALDLERTELIHLSHLPLIDERIDGFVMGDGSASNYGWSGFKMSKQKDFDEVTQGLDGLIVWMLERIQSRNGGI